MFEQQAQLMYRWKQVQSLFLVTSLVDTYLQLNCMEWIDWSPRMHIGR